ncbi:hypothetical protein FI667_g16896, partial [Globisporangium splendens]
MLRRFGNAILAATLLAVCASEGVRAGAYDSVAVQEIGGDAAYGATPDVVLASSSGSGSDVASIPPVTAASTPAPVIINVEEEPVTAPPSTTQPPASDASESSSGSGSVGPTISISEDEVGNEGDVTQSAYTPAPPAATPAATPTSPAAIPAATTSAPAATPATTTAAPAATTSAPTPAATPAATTPAATTTAPPPFTVSTNTNNLTPTVTPAATKNTSTKKRKDCDPQFPEEEPSPVTPAPSVPAATPAATTTVTSNNGVVKAPSDVLDVSTSNVVAYAQSAPAPSADDDAPVVKISAKSDEGSEDNGSGVGATVGLVGAVAAVAVVGTALMHIKKKREDEKLSTPREQFGELRATPAGNAVL